MSQEFLGFSYYVDLGLKKHFLLFWNIHIYKAYSRSKTKMLRR